MITLLTAQAGFSEERQSQLEGLVNKVSVLLLQPGSLTASQQHKQAG